MPDLYFLIEFPIFRELDGEDIDALSPLAEELALKGGDAVVKEGEPADAMYVVKSGVLDVCRSVQGEIKHINLLSAGEFFGEMALVDGSPRSADVLVKEDAVLIKLSNEAYKRLRKEKPSTALKIADVLLKTLSFRVRRSTQMAMASEAASSTNPSASSGQPSAGSGQASGQVPKPKKARPAPKKEAVKAEKKKHKKDKKKHKKDKKKRK